MEWKVEIIGWKDDFNDQRHFILKKIQEILRKYYNSSFIEEFPLTIGYRSSTCICEDKSENPCSHPDRSRICLNVEDTYWCQYIFQLSHELCHCITSRNNLPKAIRWFDEFLCCFTSYFILKQFESDYEIVNYLYPNNKEAFKRYISDIEKLGLKSETDPKKLFINKREEYLCNEDKIKKDDIYYLYLYRKLNTDFSGLSFIGKIHLIDFSEVRDVETLMSKLIADATENELGVLDIISDLFSLSIYFK